MDLTPHVTRLDGGDERPRRVRVPGRDDIGEVIMPGVNLGVRHNIYAAIVHFPETGECVHYDAKRLTYLDP